MLFLEYLSLWWRFCLKQMVLGKNKLTFSSTALFLCVGCLLTDLNTELFFSITIELLQIHLSLFLFPGFNGTVCIII